MSAQILRFVSAERFHGSAGFGANANADDEQRLLQAEIERLERLDHDLQVQAHRINLSIGDIRRQRLTLLKRVACLQSA